MYVDPTTKKRFNVGYLMKNSALLTPSEENHNCNVTMSMLANREKWECAFCDEKSGIQVKEKAVNGCYARKHMVGVGGTGHSANAECADK